MNTKKKEKNDKLSDSDSVYCVDGIFITFTLNLC